MEKEPFHMYSRWWFQICFFHPYLGKISILTNIFQRVETTKLYCFKCLKDQDPTKYENDIQVFLLKSWWDQENPTVERMGQGCKRNKSPRHIKALEESALAIIPTQFSEIRFLIYFQPDFLLLVSFLARKSRHSDFPPQTKREKKVTGILQCLESNPVTLQNP